MVNLVKKFDDLDHFDDANLPFYFFKKKKELEYYFFENNIASAAIKPTTAITAPITLVVFDGLFIFRERQ